MRCRSGRDSERLHFQDICIVRMQDAGSCDAAVSISRGVNCHNIVFGL
jgi:hypothetical protein